MNRPLLDTADARPDPGRLNIDPPNNSTGDWKKANPGYSSVVSPVAFWAGGSEADIAKCDVCGAAAWEFWGVAGTIVCRDCPEPAPRGIPEDEQPVTLPCCIGIDMPGVGLMHSDECMVGLREIARNREYLPGHVPEPLHSFVKDPPCRTSAGVVGVEVRELIAEIDGALSTIDARRSLRDGLLGQLIFAANNLAQRNLTEIRYPSIFAGGSDCEKKCRECEMIEHLGHLAHTRSCCTGRTLGVIAELIETLDQPEGKEAASGNGTGCAGDGIRPRGLNERACLKCGLRDNNWQAEWRPESEVYLKLLGLNQCVSASSTGEGHTLYTHRCEALPLRVFIDRTDAYEERQDAAKFGGAQ